MKKGQIFLDRVLTHDVKLVILNIDNHKIKYEYHFSDKYGPYIFETTVVNFLNRIKNKTSI